jgi:hypothetical protein
MNTIDMSSIKRGLIVSLISLILAIFLGFQIGFWNGYTKSNEDQKKWDCEIKYGLKPQSEISGNCLKYFKSK